MRIDDKTKGKHRTAQERPVTQVHAPLSGPEKEKRKERVLAQGMHSITGSIADAVVIKNGNLFFLCKPGGSVPLANHHGYGLYYNDCRYLNGYELRVAQAKPSLLVSDASRGFAVVFELTNEEIQVAEGVHIPKDQIGIQWERVLDGEQLCLREVLTFVNYALEPIEFSVTFDWSAEFEDIFAVRGLWAEHPGQLHPPRWEGDTLEWVYAGADGLERRLSVLVTPEPESKRDGTAQFDLGLAPRESRQLELTLQVSEHRDGEDGHRQYVIPHLSNLKQTLAETCTRWLAGETRIESDSVVLNKTIERAQQDLRMLRSNLDGQHYFAAGLPWFGTLFGRDSLITALQTLAFDPSIALETLPMLAKYQGQKVDRWRDEQPGKILHEIRVGELARLGQIPHQPYYGTVDATPLFLILLARSAAWNGDRGLFEQLHEHVERALNWLDEYGDANGDGYVDYVSTSEHGLINQGWKDSGDAVVNGDGSLAEPPIALVEVQGYVYMAKQGIADLYERAGDKARAQSLRQSADALRERFNRDFWRDEMGFYALCRQKGGQPADVIASNAGQALWTGIVAQDKAEATVKRLMQADMFAGWGIRTLSAREKRYNPISYHLGTIWPHDNSIIAAGFRRYGFDKEAARVANGIFKAAMHQPGYRLPELFAGFGEDMYDVPVGYPVACHPQAWAAGAALHLMEMMLGLHVDADEHRLRIERPMLPDYVDRLMVHGLRVGEARVDLYYARTADHSISVQVRGVEGQLDVVMGACAT